jgi:hypothetical protein
VPRFHEEAFELLIYLDDVVGVARLGHHHVPGLDIVFGLFGDHLRFTSYDKP